MTRRQALSVGLGSCAVMGAAARNYASSTGLDLLRLNALGRSDEREGAVGVEAELLRQPTQTAIIICDMWGNHYCRSAVSRLEAMIPYMNLVISAARARGTEMVIEHIERYWCPTILGAGLARTEVS